MRLLFLLIGFFLFSCSTWKESLKKVGGKDDAIQNAVLDFSHTKKLFSQDSVFYVGVDDTLSSFKLISENENTSGWVVDKVYTDIIGISIIGGEMPYQKKDFGNTDVRIPSRYIVEQDRLFLWYDEDYPVTEELINVLNQFNLIIENNSETLVVFDDAKKGASYYFCRNDLSDYKKQVSSIAMGYDVPKLKCPK